VSVGLVAVVMGLGAFFGVLLSQQKTRLVPEPLPTEALTDAHGHQHLWSKILPPPNGKLYWGAFRLGAPYKTRLVSSLETEVARRPAVLMWYQEWADQPSFPVDEAAWLFDRGIVPMVTWEPWKPPAVTLTAGSARPTSRATWRTG